MLMRQIMAGHEIKSQIGQCRPGVSFIELGHGGSRARKRGWLGIFAYSNLGFDFVTQNWPPS